MANHSKTSGEDRTMYVAANGSDPYPHDGCTHCQIMSGLLRDFQSQLEELEQKLGERAPDVSQEREFYTVAEFAVLVERSIFRVREWCRLYRINAEKADWGHGDSKAWKIPASELTRYRDHGLLPIPDRY